MTMRESPPGRGVKALLHLLHLASSGVGGAVGRSGDLGTGAGDFGGRKDAVMPRRF
jgi:hypothetical protein